ncbi:MAG: hypothetical protein IPL01_19800 [Acidobacteria bacterium]|nr:hypothetical protein [Acidobacteriota bacterium]
MLIIPAGFDESGESLSIDLQHEAEGRDIFIHLEIEAIDIVIGEGGEIDPPVAIFFELVLFIFDNDRRSPPRR